MLLSGDLKAENEYSDLDWIRDRMRPILDLKEVLAAMAPGSRVRFATKSLGELELQTRHWGQGWPRPVWVRLLRRARKGEL